MLSNEADRLLLGRRSIAVLRRGNGVERGDEPAAKDVGEARKGEHHRVGRRAIFGIALFPNEYASIRPRAARQRPDRRRAVASALQGPLAAALQTDEPLAA